MRFLMCRPDYYGIKYEINPWMSVKHSVDHPAAIKQWNTFYQTLLSCKAKIDLVPPVEGWPDMVFTANAGLLYQNKIILPHFKFKERQGELPYFKDWFVQSGFQLWNQVENHSPFFEGAGDALPVGDKLFAGYGPRSDRNFYETASYLDKNKLIYCELTDPYFYHIDTCFCPISDKVAIWYPPAFTQDSQTRMLKEIELMPTIEEEARRFACNAVALDKNIILPEGCPQITAQLEQRGYRVHACEMHEYLKAGGACKCLTLRID